MSTHSPLNIAMDEHWSAEVQADQDENGMFVPVLVIQEGTKAGLPLRIKIGGLYAARADAIEAGREAVRSMLYD